MKYCSTRNAALRITVAEAIAGGLSSDGGLYLPVSVPRLTEKELEELCPLSYRERAERILALYLDDFGAEEIKSFCAAAYGEKYDAREIAPLRVHDESTAFLELWHGPTCAFKDMALQIDRKSVV